MTVTRLHPTEAEARQARVDAAEPPDCDEYGQKGRKMSEENDAALDFDAIEARAKAASYKKWRVLYGARTGTLPEAFVEQSDGQEVCRFNDFENDEDNAKHIAGMDPRTTLALVALARRASAPAVDQGGSEIVTDELIAKIIPAAVIFADAEDHVADLRRRAKDYLLAALTAARPNTNAGEVTEVMVVAAFEKLGITEQEGAYGPAVDYETVEPALRAALAARGARS